MDNNNKIELILKTVEEFEKAFLTGYSGNALQARKDMLKEYGKYLLERVLGLPTNENSGLHLQSVNVSFLSEGMTDKLLKQIGLLAEKQGSINGLYSIYDGNASVKRLLKEIAADYGRQVDFLKSVLANER